MTGNDGRFRGHLRIAAEGDRLRASELMQKTGVHVVKSLDGAMLKGDEPVYIGEKVKAVLQDGKATLLVFAESEAESGETFWRTCTKQQLRRF